MIPRPFWLQRLESAWRSASIVWLSGVRRCGKTTLARMLGGEADYLNCDLPSTAERLRDPELFYRHSAGRMIVFDEIHQLEDPARLLKIAADEFADKRIVATGSSTLAASRKFSDMLTGRKRDVHLTPVLVEELPAFGVSLERRLARGGLPPALLAAAADPAFFREWLDSFFARDLQRLYGFRDLNRFTTLFEYLLRQSGGQFELTRTAAAVGVTRPTVESHLRALEATHAVTLVRPFSGGGQNELIRQPKIYAFDTGFVCSARGWDPPRPNELGHLFEHLVLEQLQAYCPWVRPLYWRDKAGHEIDFVLPGPRDRVDTLECKWSADAFDAEALRAFRARYPVGANYLVTPAVVPAYPRHFGDLEVLVCGPTDLAAAAARLNSPDAA